MNADGRRFILIFCLICVHLRSSATDSSAQTRPATNPALWQRMTEINDRGLTFTDLAGEFEQQKFTPLLKKPMVSAGAIKARGSVMLWDTKTPSPTVMRVDEKGVSLYYPRQKTLEVFPIDAKLGALAASPLPDLKVLKQYFSFEQMSVKDLDAKQTEENSLAVKLRPINDAIGQHVDRVLVLLDAQTGFLRRLEMFDRDGERTVITFFNLKGGVGLTDAELELQLPAGTKTVRPLENLGPSRAK